MIKISQTMMWEPIPNGIFYVIRILKIFECFLYVPTVSLTFNKIGKVKVYTISNIIHIFIINMMLSYSYPSSQFVNEFYSFLVAKPLYDGPAFYNVFRRPRYYELCHGPQGRICEINKTVINVWLDWQTTPSCKIQKIENCL